MTDGNLSKNHIMLPFHMMGNFNAIGAFGAGACGSPFGFDDAFAAEPEWYLEAAQVCQGLGWLNYAMYLHSMGQALAARQFRRPRRIFRAPRGLPPAMLMGGPGMMGMGCGALGFSPLIGGQQLLMQSPLNKLIVS